MLLFLVDLLRWYPIPRGTLSAGALNRPTRGWENGDFRVIFDVKRRLSRKRCKIGRWLLWNVKEVMGAGLNGIIFDELEWPLTRVSRSLYTYKSNILKRCNLGTKLLKNTNRKPYTIYRMVDLPLSMTLSDLWPRFQGHDIFRHWISQKRHEIEP